MKFFIDTADLDEIREALSWGCLAGVTTNPSLYARTGGKLADFEDHMVKIAKMCDGLPVSAESQAKTTEGMIEEGRHLASLAPNIVVKLPICAEALAATHTLAAEGVRINMTLIFSAPQALLAANAGARYVGPFVGRFDDIGEDGISELANVVTCIQNYDWTGKNVDDEVEIDHRLRPHAQPRDPGRPHGRRHCHRALRRPQEVPQAPPDRSGHGLLRCRLGQGRRRPVIRKS